jgi:hypothetical protein
MSWLNYNHNIAQAVGERRREVDSGLGEFIGPRFDTEILGQDQSPWRRQSRRRTVVFRELVTVSDKSFPVFGSDNIQTHLKSGCIDAKYREAGRAEWV